MTLRIYDATPAEQYQWHLYVNKLFTKVFVDLHRAISENKSEKAMQIIENIREYAKLEIEGRQEFCYDLEVNLAKLEVLEKFKELLV